jgi:hypothetical protein
MPLGQFTGERKPYLYTSDGGDIYLIQTDTTLGDIEECGLVAATTANVGDATTPPKRFKPRVTYWQGELDGKVVRKKLVCNRTSDLTEATAPTAITIDGVVGSTTGRRGEQLSFLALPAGDDDAPSPDPQAPPAPNP